MNIVQLIEVKRTELCDAITQKSSYTHHTVIRLSQELDDLLNQYTSGRGKNQ